MQVRDKDSYSEFRMLLSLLEVMGMHVVVYFGGLI